MKTLIAVAMLGLGIIGGVAAASAAPYDTNSTTFFEQVENTGS